MTSMWVVLHTSLHYLKIYNEPFLLAIFCRNFANVNTSLLAFLCSVGLSLNRNTCRLLAVLYCGIAKKKKKKNGAQPVGVIWGSMCLMLHWILVLKSELDKQIFYCALIIWCSLKFHLQESLFTKLGKRPEGGHKSGYRGDSICLFDTL